LVLSHHTAGDFAQYTIKIYWNFNEVEIWNRYSHIIGQTPQGWKEKHKAGKETENKSLPEEIRNNAAGPPSTGERASAWVRLIKKGYGVDSHICLRCGKDMKIISIILDPEETIKILRHLVKIGRPLPNFDSDSLNYFFFS
jgi:hypothetical protein